MSPLRSLLSKAKSQVSLPRGGGGGRRDFSFKKFYEDVKKEADKIPDPHERSKKMALQALRRRGLSSPRFGSQRAVLEPAMQGVVIDRARRNPLALVLAPARAYYSRPYFPKPTQNDSFKIKTTTRLVNVIRKGKLSTTLFGVYFFGLSITLSLFEPKWFTECMKGVDQRLSKIDTKQDNMTVALRQIASESMKAVDERLSKVDTKQDNMMVALRDISTTLGWRFWPWNWGKGRGRCEGSQ